jgi:hypothetical protein
VVEPAIDVRIDRIGRRAVIGHRPEEHSSGRDGGKKQNEETRST